MERKRTEGTFYWIWLWTGLQEMGSEQSQGQGLNTRGATILMINKREVLTSGHAHIQNCPCAVCVHLIRKLYTHP